MINKKTLFDNIDDEEHETIIDHFTSRRYKKNHILIFEDSPFESIYIVKSGLLKIYRSYEGKETIIGFADVGDIIGEIELFSESNSTSSVEVLEDAELYIISKKEFEKIVLENRQLLVNLLKVSSDRIRQLNRQVRGLTFHSVHSRLCQALLTFAENLSGDPIVIKRLNQNILADMIGATRESVSKAFRDLQKEKIVTYETNRITILDYEQLKKYSSSEI